MKSHSPLNCMAVMPFTLRCVKLFGFRGGLHNRAHFLAALAYRLVVINLPKVAFGLSDQIDVAIRSVSELLFQWHIDIRVVLFAAKVPEFEQLVRILRRVYNKVKTLDSNSSERKLIEDSNRSLDRRSKSYALYVAVAVTIFYWVPVVQTSTIWLRSLGDNSTTRPKYVMMMEMEFYGLDTRGNIWHYLVYASLSSIAHYYSAVYFALAGMVIFSCIKSIAALFELVSAKLATLHELSGKALREELAELVELHVDGLRCIKLLEDIHSLVMMAQMVNCVLIWISMILSISTRFTSETTSLLVLLIVMTGETYVLCQLATELSEVSLTITDSIWNSHWIKLPVDVRKGLAMMLQRAQKKEGLTAAKFFFMDVERFGRVLQTSYSIYVVLKERL
ncbi:conserved hypothetical protein [Culex quinquefasciatus]|uniref:Odorant receptor n=1 Tax=Culex quinquefasciatus TaxID=7176 RepID=B0W0I0_CULQU|nr:conserved hypothetical protein [Culex quinquefasciatus]|eukprot:XP_001842214.1 conserved hypothetical protein [Culex quinquefasciatus]